MVVSGDPHELIEELDWSKEELLGELEELVESRDVLSCSLEELDVSLEELCTASAMELSTSSLNEDELFGMSTITWFEEAGVGGSIEELVSGAITPANGG